MEIIFIDYENVALMTLEASEISPSDKVKIFSHGVKAKEYADEKNFICHHNYPEGGNQADFYIIACLVKELIGMSEQEKKTVVFSLHTGDKDLATAFQFQCELFGCQSKNISIKYSKPTKKYRELGVDQTEQEKEALDKKNRIRSQFLSILKKPTKLSEVQLSLSLTEPEFRGIFSDLVKKHKIRRHRRNSNRWVLKEQPKRKLKCEVVVS